MITERTGHDGLTKAEAAVALDVSIRTVTRYISTGHLTAAKRKNGRVYITAQSVEEFLRGEPALAAEPQLGGPR